MPKNKHLIFILGMHRSGTSTLTRLCNLLGAELSTPLLRGVKNINEKGFWELLDALYFHERLLAALGSRWDDSKFLPNSWWNNETVKPYHNQLSTIINKHFGPQHPQPLWAVKDPRLCRLVPIWLPAVEKLHIKPLFIIPYRNPFEVSMSLEKRDRFPREKSLLLWLQHIIEAEQHSRPYPRIFIRYKELFKDTQKIMASISDNLDIEWPIAYGNASDKIAQFLTPTLHHFKDTTAFNDRTPLTQKHNHTIRWVRNAMNALMHLDNNGITTLQTIKHDMLSHEAVKKACAHPAPPSNSLSASQNHSEHMQQLRHLLTTNAIPERNEPATTHPTENFATLAIIAMLFLLIWQRTKNRGSQQSCSSLVSNVTDHSLAHLQPITSNDNQPGSSKWRRSHADRNATRELYSKPL